MSFYRTSDDVRIGKCINVDANTGLVTLEYFQSPAESVELVDVPQEKLEACPISEIQRVYVHQNGNWTFGKYVEIQGDNAYINLFGDMPQVFPISDIFIPHTPPDPSNLLKVGLFESMYNCERRNAIIKQIIKQRAGCLGLTGLLSSSVEIAPHQIEVIGRVLRDPIQRYILADEVGLGKTIEAGAILRQHIIDNPMLNDIIIITPEHLIQQWKDELREKFFLDELFYSPDDAFVGGSIYFYGYSELNHIEYDGRDIDMLIIDEAHQIYQRVFQEDDELFTHLKHLATIAQKVLLLSGTPALNNESEFLAMLSILDPQNYNMSEIDGFRQKVNLRTDIGSIHRFFQPDNLFLPDYIERLKTLTTDETLHLELEDLNNYLIEENMDRVLIENKTKKIRNYIGEKYRIHNRLLRNSRSSLSNRINMGRDKLEIVEYNEEQHIYGHADRLIQSLIGIYSAINENEENINCLIRDLLRSYLKSWTTLNNYIEERLQLPVSPIELGYLNELQNLIPQINEHRNSRVVEAILEFVYKHNRKILVFAADEDFDQLSHVFSEQFDDDFVALNRNVSQDTYNEIATDQYISVILCREIHQQGLNLQKGDPAICHYSLPFSPNELEQRIGRVDRFGSSKPVLSLILLSSSETIKRSWVNFLDEQFKVFTHSIANLQYMVDEILEHLINQIRLWGLDGVQNTITEYGGENGRIATEISRLSSFDSLNSLDSFISDSQVLSNFKNIDDDYFGISSSTLGWVGDVLKLNILDRNNQRLNLNNNNYDPRSQFRYQFSRNTIIPKLLFFDNIPAFMNGKSTSPNYTFDRGTSLRNHIRLARLGDVFFNAVSERLTTDETGKTFGLIRTTNQIQQDYQIYFKFDYILQACVTDGVDNHYPEALLIKESDLFFPPQYLTQVLDQHGLEVRNAEILRLLHGSYNSTVNDMHYLDFDLDPARWNRFKEHSLINDELWKEMCQKVADMGYGNCYSHFSELIESNITKYENHIAELHFIYEDRPEYEELFKLKNAVFNSLENYDISVASCGVIILASTNFGGEIV